MGPFFYLNLYPLPLSTLLKTVAKQCPTYITLLANSPTDNAYCPQAPHHLSVFDNSGLLHIQVSKNPVKGADTKPPPQ